MDYKPNATHEKANQMGAALCSLVVAAIAAYLVWSFGGGAPWWAYAMLFTRSVIGFAQALSDEQAMQKATDDSLGELPITAGDAPICDVEKGAFEWEASGLSAD